jgi:hypothetical protein
MERRVEEDQTVDSRMPPDDRFSFHTFEHDALAHLVALVVAHTQSTAADIAVLDTTLNRVLAEHGVKSIDAFNEAVSRHLQIIEEETTP